MRFASSMRAVSPSSSSVDEVLVHNLARHERRHRRARAATRIAPVSSPLPSAQIKNQLRIVYVVKVVIKKPLDIERLTFRVVRVYVRLRPTTWLVGVLSARELPNGVVRFDMLDRSSSSLPLPVRMCAHIISTILSISLFRASLCHSPHFPHVPPRQPPTPS